MEGYLKKAAEQLIKENPKLPTRAIARMMEEKYRGKITFDSARSAVMHARGENKNRLKHINPDIIPRTEEEKKQALVTKFSCPVPDSSNWKIYNLPKNINKWLIISDVHIPYHDKCALDTAISYGKEQGCDGLIINGDFIDAYHESDFCKNPLARNTVSEIDMAKDVLKMMVDYLKPQKIIFKCGNHDWRIDSYIMRHAPVLYGLDGLTLPKLLELDSIGADFVEINNIMRFNRLSIFHGQEFGRGLQNPVNPARNI